MNMLHNTYIQYVCLCVNRAVECLTLIGWQMWSY